MFLGNQFLPNLSDQHLSSWPPACRRLTERSGLPQWSGYLSFYHYRKAEWRGAAVSEERSGKRKAASYLSRHSLVKHERVYAWSFGLYLCVCNRSF